MKTEIANLSDGPSPTPNLAMLCDFYEFTMSGGYLKTGMHKVVTHFDLFFRRVPDGGGFAITAGLAPFIHYLENLHFTRQDIDWLRGRGVFDEAFLSYLETFRFTGDVDAVPEGTPVFPNEPLLTVRAPAIEAQIIETFALLCLNHQSLIATKANRIVRAAQGRTVLEFGSRRAQGADAAVEGARAAYLAGCHGTACTLADQLHGVPAAGTMAHAWVQMFPSEYEAFRTYCELYPENTTLLVDTYNTLKSGVPNAIRVFSEILVPRGVKQFAIRLDSGDIAWLSKEARRMLDEAGLTQCRIVASNSLDETLIRDLLLQGARVDAFGVGERLITARSEPVFGGVYKLVAVEDAEGNIHPRIKVSDNVGKIPTPHAKKVYRLYDRKTGKAIADQLCLWNETIDPGQPLTLFDPEAEWKTKTVEDFVVRDLLVPIFRNGKRVYQPPTLEESRRYCLSQVDTLWDEVTRFENPHAYYVDLSRQLWQIRRDLLEAAGHQ